MGELVEGSGRLKRLPKGWYVLLISKFHPLIADNFLEAFEKLPDKRAPSLACEHPQIQLSCNRLGEAPNRSGFLAHPPNQLFGGFSAQMTLSIRVERGGSTDCALLAQAC